MAWKVEGTYFEFDGKSGFSTSSFSWAA